MALFSTISIFYSLQVYNGTAADIRMVGVTLHQSSVIVANLYLALITAQWVRKTTNISTFISFSPDYSNFSQLFLKFRFDGSRPYVC